MIKKSIFFIILIIFAVALIGGYLKYFAKKETTLKNPATQCKINQITFYYLEGCEWCNKVKNEGTIQKIEALGVRVKMIDAAVGPVRDKFTSVPTFAIDGNVYAGYRTFEEIRELLVCPKEEADLPLDETDKPSTTTLATSSTDALASSSSPLLLDEASKPILEKKVVEAQEGKEQPLKEINIKAFKFGYEPNIINATKGEKIKINIENADVLHGMIIPDLGLKGDQALEFTANQTGEFTWYCVNFCGGGHKSMQGKLIIK